MPEIDETALLAKVKTEAGTAAKSAAKVAAQEFLDDNEKIKGIQDTLNKITGCKSADDINEILPELGKQIDSINKELLGYKAELQKYGKKSKIVLTPQMKTLGNSLLRGLKSHYIAKKKGEKSIMQRFIDQDRSIATAGLSMYASKRQVLESGSKADVPMSEGVSIVPIGSGIPTLLTQFEPEIMQPTRRKPYMAALTELSATLSRFVSWMEKTNILAGQAYMVAENGSNAANYGSFRLTQNSTELQKINALSQLTTEILEDYSETKRLVQEEIFEIMQLKLDSQILNGPGSGANLKGALQYAQGFSNVGNLSVPAPNNVDVIIAAILQMGMNGDIVAAGAEPLNIYEPTDLVLHPADATQMALTKDTLNRYILDIFPFLDKDGNMVRKIQNVNITDNIGMTQGSFFLGDMKKAHTRIRKDASLTLGYVNADFRDGTITVKGEMRAGFFIAANQVKAFISDTFSNGKAAIQAA